MTKLVKSPGGDSIEVIPDPEFLEVFEANPYDLRQWNKRRAIFTALWKHGAYVDKASGRATAMLTNDTRNLGRMASPAAFNGMFASSPTVAACIERDINGKRTYRIQLMRLPELYYNKLLAVSGGANKPKPEPEPEPYADAKPEVFVLEVAPEPAPAFDSMAVAQHLLGLVIDKINEPTPEPVILEPSPDMQDLGQAVRGHRRTRPAGQGAERDAGPLRSGAHRRRTARHRHSTPAAHGGQAELQGRVT
jgi:hypothetical protein